MIILGLNSHEINSSCAFLKNGKVIFGSNEERFNREKLTKEFPLKSITYFLNKNDLKLDSIHSVAQAWNPAANMVKFNPLLSSKRIKREDYFYSIPDNILNLDQSNKSRDINEFVEMNFGKKNIPRVYFIQHHKCHAANAYFLSNFDSSTILTCDFRGEFESTTLSVGRGNKIKQIRSMEMPNSLGMFYATITQFLGYKPDEDEWKVMAMSAFKNKDKSYLKKIKQLYNLLPNGNVNFNKEYFKGEDLSRPNLYNNKLLKLFGNKSLVERNKKFSDWHISVASALQSASEEIALHLINNAFQITKNKNLALGGGFFMNSVLNGKILERSKFKNIYIPYAPTDSGNSIGAALYLNHCIMNKSNNKIENTSLIGPKFSDKEIEISLKKRKVKFYKVNQIEKEISKLIIKHGYVGHFYGNSEFGDRALGNRSILGDPRYKKIKDKINSAIKYREFFRPFAPMVLDQHAENYFEVSKGFTSNYMEKVVKIRKKYIEKLGAVAHIDNSARIQTINIKNNLRLGRILNEFNKLAGVPILLNTSFNVAGEPMVLNPDDALTTFFNSGLMALVMNNYIIEKNL